MRCRSGIWGRISLIHVFFDIDIAFRIDMKAEKSTACSILIRPPLPSPPRLVFCCRHSRGGFVRCRLLGSIGDRHFDNYYAIEKGGRRGNEIVRTRVTSLSSSSAGSEACHPPGDVCTLYSQRTLEKIGRSIHVSPNISKHDVLYHKMVPTVYCIYIV